MHEATELLEQSALDPRRSAIEIAKMLFQVAAIRKPAWRRHLGESAEITRNHQHSRRRSCENQLLAPCRSLHGELLGDRTAPGNAHDMDALGAERIEQLRSATRKHPTR